MMSAGTLTSSRSVVIRVQVSETSSPSGPVTRTECSATRTGSRSSIFPEGAFSQLIRDPPASQPLSPASWNGNAMPPLARGDDVPSGQQDREDHVMAGEVPVKHRDTAREQAGLLGREGLQQGLLAVGRLAEDGAADRAAGAGGQRDDPQLRERGGPVPGPGRAEISPVL